MRVHNPIWRVSLQGEIWTQTGAQGGHCVKTKAETEVILSKPLEARTEAWNGFFPAGLRRSKPCRYLDLGFLISTTARQQISIALNHPTCGALLRRLSEWIQQMRTVSFGALYVLYHAHVLSIKKTIFFSTQIFVPSQIHQAGSIAPTFGLWEYFYLCNIICHVVM